MFATNMFVNLRCGNEHVRYAVGMAKPGLSRRERPAKPALTRAWIIEATIEIMQTEGLEKATMRRVAQVLDTGPASLYVYIANTAELHAAVLDELLAALPPEPAGDGSWNQRLEDLLRAYADILFTYPGLARSALLLRPTGPNAIRLYDQVLGLLLEGGIAVDRAAWGVDLLLQYVTGSAAEHSTPTLGERDALAGGDPDMSILAQALHAADPRTTPHIAGHADAVLSGEPTQRITWAIQAIIAGIASTPIPADRAATLLGPRS
jgi:AcrR family transcriptional regulator